MGVNGEQQKSVVDADLFEGYNQLMHIMLEVSAPMLVATAVKLGIPDIISKAGPLTAPQIALHLSPSPPSTSQAPEYLARMLIFLSTKGVFFHNLSTNTFGLTIISKLLCSDHDYCLAPVSRIMTDPSWVLPWRYFDQVISQGRAGYSFEIAHGGKGLFEFAEENPHFYSCFTDLMALHSKVLMKSVLQYYHGFEGVKVLVDVGGNIGLCVSTIVNMYPHVKGISFDLPHVIDGAPKLPDVEYISGDMFKSIPQADTIMLKWILHDWTDNECIQILSNCRSALRPGGKLIIIDIVMKLEESVTQIGKIKAMTDLLMTNMTKGFERTEDQWRKLIFTSGFSNVTMIELPCLISVLEVQ